VGTSSQGVDSSQKLNGTSVLNFRNHLVNISACLAFAGVILAVLPAFAAGEDAKELVPAQLSIAAAADLRFALDDLVKQFEQKYPAVKTNDIWFFREFLCTVAERRTVRPILFGGHRLRASWRKRLWVLMTCSYTQPAVSFCGRQRIYTSILISSGSKHCCNPRFTRSRSPIRSMHHTVAQLWRR